jgi:hypothetical protein
MGTLITSAALIASQSAEKTACMGLINNFKQTSNVVEMQIYAKCIDIVYPDRQLEVSIGKTLIISALIFIIIGAFIGHTKHPTSTHVVEGIFAALLIWFFLVLGLAVIGFLVYA